MEVSPVSCRLSPVAKSRNWMPARESFIMLPRDWKRPLPTKSGISKVPSSDACIAALSQPDLAIRLHPLLGWDPAKEPAGLAAALKNVHKMKKAVGGSYW